VERCAGLQAIELIELLFVAGVWIEVVPGEQEDDAIAGAGFDGEPAGFGGTGIGGAERERKHCQ